ncbi:hypothetical protein [Paenibacillus sp. CF384]|uniref:hypothetical protein n=1 Tax=Paenibacillus sp. CF384 TaxID=1884382 RepID=UPI0015A5C158|nr:hypothetical protein [Paenibacillus sp. CF384]
MNEEEENVIKREDINKAHETKIIVPSKEELQRAARTVMDKHREALERLAKQ